MTIRTPCGDTDVVLHLAAPARYTQVAPALVAAAGLPAGTALHHGVAPCPSDWYFGRAPLLAGVLLSTEPAAVPSCAPLMLAAVAGPGSGRSAPLGGTLVIGRGAGVGLQLPGPEVSRRHVAVQPGDDGISVTDLGSANGTEIDGAPVLAARSSSVLTGVLHVGGTVLRAESGLGQPALVTPDRQGHLVVSRPPRLAAPFAPALPPDPGAPPVRRRTRLGLVTALVMAAAGGLVAALTGMWMFLMLAALGPVAMLGTSISDRWQGRRGHRRAMADYTSRMAAYREARSAALHRDREDLWDRHPGPAALARRAGLPGARLWERRPGDADFLELAVGVGDRPARIPDPPLLLGCPITVMVRGVLGIAGASRGQVRYLLAQLITQHSPADLCIALLSADAGLARLRDSPHCRSPGSALGIVIAEETFATTALSALSAADGRHLVLVLDDAPRWRRIPGVAALLAAAADPDSGVSALCLAAERRALPTECSRVLQAQTWPGDVGCTTCTDTEVEQAYLDDLVSSLAALVETGPDGDLPVSARLAELLGTATGPGDEPFASSVRRRWGGGCSALSAVIGADGSGPVTLDLSRDGPHLLVAGTTGAGKSELLVTLAAALACSAGPDKLRLILIDYKGGAAFGPLKDLPHTAALLTDLDPALAERALTGLRAEIRSREAILARAGAADVTECADSGPPRMVIIIDEFATLLADLPDFVSSLVDIAQRGRSLGLHLVLATQRPAGAVSPAMRANIAARICLRVADDADSVDVIDRADAARLPRSVPGRALLRTGRGELRPLQVARVTEPVSGAITVRRRDGPPGEPSNGPITGRPPGSPPPGPSREASPPGASADTQPAGRTSRSATDLDVLVAAARTAAAGLQIPPPPFVPPLPAEMTEADLPSDRASALGLLDLPDEQCVRPLLVCGSLLVTGAPGSGVSTALRRQAGCAATAGAQVLVIDAFGGLADLADWPAVSSWLDLSDPLPAVRLLQLLHRRAADPAALGAMLLVVDGLDALAAALEPMDYGSSLGLLGQVAARGPTRGVRVAAGTGAPDGSQRLAKAFATTVALGGGPPGYPPPGRGLLGAAGTTRIRSAHAARPGTDRPAVQIVLARPGARLGRRTPPPEAIVVRPLPDSVAASGLPAPRPEAIPVGCGGDAALPLTLDLGGPGGALVVCGPPRSGVSTALAVLASGAAAAGIPVLWPFRRAGRLPPAVHGIDVRAGTDALEDALARHEGPLLLVADGLAGRESPGGLDDLLLRLLQHLGPGQYLALGTRADQALRAYHGVIAEATAARCAVLLEPDGALAALLGVTVPRREQHRPGRGYLVQDGTARRIQVAHLTTY